MSTTPHRDHPMTLPETHAKLLAELERFEHLLFEPMTQADLDRLYALSANPETVYRTARGAQPKHLSPQPRIG